MHKHIRQYSLILTLLLSLSPTMYAAEKEANLEAGMVNPGYHEKPAWFKQSFLDIDEDISEAASRNRRLILYFYQDGCPYCSKLLRDNFGQRTIAQKTQRYFDTIAINMWGDREMTWIDGDAATEKVIAERLKVMFTPTMLFLDEQGNVAFRLNGYFAPDKFDAVLEYVGRHQERKLSFNDFYQSLKKTKPSGKLHEADYILAENNLQGLMEKGDKPLLVMFEQKQCGVCDELHTDIFKRKESLEQLGRFHIVRFDIWSSDELVTPGGQVISAKEWARRLRIQYAPTMVMFDTQGNEIIRTEAYLKSFHIQSVLDYAASGAYKTQPSFQRYISERAERIEAEGGHVDLMK